MNDYSVNVTKVEELQMTSSLMELEQIFSKAQSIVVQGGAVILTRQNADGTAYKFDEITTEADLDTYKNSVFKYLQRP